MILPYQYPHGPEPLAHLPAASAMTVDIGEALTLEGGSLVKATGNTMPEYISMSKHESAKAGERIACQKVQPGVIYESVLSVANADIAVGNEYTIGADSATITATEGGHAKVVSYEGKAAGDKVYVTFA